MNSAFLCFCTGAKIVEVLFNCMVRPLTTLKKVYKSITKIPISSLSKKRGTSFQTDKIKC